MIRRTEMPRSTKPLKRSVIKRNRKPLVSELTVHASSPVRKKRPGPPRRVSVVRDQKYMDWLKSHRCIACEVSKMRSEWSEFHPYLIVDPAHTVNNGGGSKGPDSSCIPLCRRHHDEMDGRSGTKIVTKEQFAAKYGLDLAAIAADHYAEFGRRNGNDG